MLEPTHVAQYPYTASASPPSPLEPRLQQRLPSITHVTSNLHQHQQLQPLSVHNMHQHAHSMPQPLSSLPPPRQVLPPRVDSLSSVNSSTQGSVEYTPQPNDPSLSHRPRKNSTARRDSSASSSHTNQHQRRRPGGQTKAACLPCRKRKSKVCSFLCLRSPCYTPFICPCPLSLVLPLHPFSSVLVYLYRSTRVFGLPFVSRNSAMAPALPASAAPQKLQCATIALPLPA